MFSRRTSGRFPREQNTEAVPGPGSYDLPSTLERKGVGLEGPERWSETSIDAPSPGPGNYDPKACEKGSDATGALSVTELPPNSARGAREKENQAPARQLQKGVPESLSARGLREGDAHPGRKSISRARSPPMITQANSSESVDKAAEAKQMRSDLKLASQLDGVREELKTKSREAKELRSQMAAKDRRLDELQKKVDELAAQRREAHRRSTEVEGERATSRRQLHERDQEVQSLQRKNEHLRAAAEERARRAERAEEAAQVATAEAKRFRDSVEGLQEQLAAAERDRKNVDAAMRQHQRRSQDLEVNMKEHVEVLEESLRREEARRRELEERAARSGAEQEHGEAELASERRHVKELQERVARLEAEARSRLAQVEEWAKERQRLEDEALSAKARSAAQEDATARNEERRRELETRAARAEVAMEAKVRELERETQKTAALETELREAREEGQAQLRSQLEEAESRLRAASQELEEERGRSEELERRVAAHEERARGLALASSASVASLQPEGSDERAQRLQDKLELAEEEIQRWKEWADEQSLRELTAETQRLEEIKRVREDVGAQVEAAKKEVVNENNELQKRIRQLEKGPEGAVQAKVRLIELERKLADHAEAVARAEEERDRARKQAEQACKEASSLKKELEAAQQAAEAEGRRADEERRGLEASLSRAAADRSVVEEELSDEKERLQAQLRALRVEHDAAMSAHGQEIDTIRAAEREAWAQREEHLEKALGAARAAAAEARWRLLSEGLSEQRGAAASEAGRGGVLHAAARWRALACGHEKDAEMLGRQTGELERLDEEAESLRAQNRHILLSLQTAQQELQMATSECRRLQEREDACEQEADRIADQNAALGGHSNPKQKIKHLMSVKAENQSLRQDLKKSKLQVVQLESRLRTAQFFDAAADVAPATAPSSGRHTPARQKPREEAEHQTPTRARAGAPPAPKMPGQPRTPARSASASSLHAAADVLAQLADDRPEAARRERAEAARHARAHRRASEKAVVEYQHLAALVEQALATGCLGGPQPTASPGPATAPASGAATPVPQPSAAAADPSALLDRLRKLSASTGQRAAEGETKAM